MAELGLRASPHRYSPEGPRVLAVSALLGLGLEELKAEVEDAIMRATGRQVLTLRVRLAGPQLRCVGLSGGRGGGPEWLSGPRWGQAAHRAVSLSYPLTCSPVSPGD